MGKVSNRVEDEKGSWGRHVGDCESRYGHDGLVNT